MNPENPQTTPPIQPTPPVTPVTPQPATPYVQPVQPIQQQPAGIPQPASSAQFASGMNKAPTSANLQKQKKIALALAILSILIFIGGLFAGYVFGLAILLGAYALAIGIRTKSIPIIVLGAIASLVNLIVYIISIVAK